jgi:hypothetical protein
VYKVDATRAKTLIGNQFAPLRSTVIETINMYKRYLQT